MKLSSRVLIGSQRSCNYQVITHVTSHAEPISLCSEFACWNLVTSCGLAPFILLW